jgi:hypothetical protein
MVRVPLKKKDKALTANKINIENILNLIDTDLQDKLVEQFKVDKWVTKLKANLLFKLILFTLFKDRYLSLRAIADNYSTFQFRSFEHYALGKTAHSSIQNRLETLNYRYVEAIYKDVYARVEKVYGCQQLEHKYNIIRFDSTLAHSFSHLIQGMHVGNTSRNKVQVKFATVFKGEGLLNMHFFNDQAHLSEETTLSELVLTQSYQDKDLVVFDMGLKGREHWVQIHEQGTVFVTRALENIRKEVIESYAIVDNYSEDGRLRFVSDEKVFVYQSRNKKETRVAFRLICAIDVYSGKSVNFVTNSFGMDCRAVAACYRKRWEIEVLFRFMKQEMHLGHLVSHHLNGILNMLYITQIAAMLVLLYKNANDITGHRTAKRQFYKAFELHLIDKMTQDEEHLQILKANIKELKE